MSYENQLIREATGEGTSKPFNPFGDETLEAVGEIVFNETGDQQGEIVSPLLAGSIAKGDCIFQ